MAPDKPEVRNIAGLDQTKGIASSKMNVFIELKD
jgi:hypothetical protein